MAVAKVQNLKQGIAKIDAQTLQYMAQLIAENSLGLQNIVNTVLSFFSQIKPKATPKRVLLVDVR